MKVPCCSISSCATTNYHEAQVWRKDDFAEYARTRKSDLERLQDGWRWFRATERICSCPVSPRRSSRGVLSVLFLDSLYRALTSR